MEHLLGDDLMGLLFHFLDELLFLMCDDPYFIVKVSNTMLLRKYESRITGRERLIRSHSSARFCFELSGNSN